MSVSVQLKSVAVFQNIVGYQVPGRRFFKFQNTTDASLLGFSAVLLEPRQARASQIKRDEGTLDEACVRNVTTIFRYSHIS